MTVQKPIQFIGHRLGGIADIVRDQQDGVPALQFTTRIVDIGFSFTS